MSEVSGSTRIPYPMSGKEEWVVVASWEFRWQARGKQVRADAAGLLRTKAWSSASIHRRIEAMGGHESRAQAWSCPKQTSRGVPVLISVSEAGGRRSNASLPSCSKVNFHMEFNMSPGWEDN